MQIEFPLWKCIANCKNSDRTPRRQTINTCKKQRAAGPFGLFAKTPVCCKIRKKLNGDPLETLKIEKNEIFERCHSAEKCKRETLWDFLTSILLHNIETNERGTLWCNPIIFKKSHSAEVKNTKKPKGSLVCF